MVNPDRMIRGRRTGDPARIAAAATVWVLDGSGEEGSAEALGIAERLGVPFRRIALSWNWLAYAATWRRNGSLVGISDRGRGIAGLLAARLAGTGREHPKLVISSGRRTAPVARWLKQQLGCGVVHCAGRGRPVGRDFDLLVSGERDGSAAPNAFPVLGSPHRFSPDALAAAAGHWADRLDYLPRPRVALLVGGPARGSDLQPVRTHALGATVARAVSAAGGAVLATTTQRTGSEAGDALAAGLGRAMHLIHRWAEPGENPYPGFLAIADAVIVAGDSAAMLGEACATSGPVYAALADLAGGRHRRLLVRLTEAGQIRAFRGDIAAFSRPPLDEAGRVAAELRRRFALG